MAIELSRLEAGIYHCELAGLVTLDDIIDTQQQGLTIAEDHDDDAHVLILSVDPRVKMPFDIRRTSELVDNNHAAAILVVGATLHVRFIASMMTRLFSKLGTVEHQRTVSRAVERARDILRQRTKLAAD